MRSFHHIDLGAQSVRTDTLEGEDIVRAGRYLIAKTLDEENIAKVCLLYTSPSPRDRG